MKDLILYGAGGHCFAALELIKSLGEFKPVVIYDDAPPTSSILGVPVTTVLKPPSEKDVLCISIGDNRSRKRIAELYSSVYPSFVHASASVYPSARIGDGTVIFPNSVVDAGVQIGDFCIVNNNATISHNVKVSNFCHIAINAAIAGGVTMGEGTLIGAGSIILPNVQIGQWAVIGAGAIVTKDVPDFAVVMGQSASIIKYNTPE